MTIRYHVTVDRQGEEWWRSIRGLHVDLPPIRRYQIDHSNVLVV
jgi:hypothetical protein